LKVNQSATLITDTATLCHFTNNFLYLRGGSAGLSIGDDAFSNSITLADNSDIAFEAGSAERMRITSSGYVGIGTPSPVLRLDVKGAAADTTTVGGITVEQSTLFRPSNDAGGLRFGFDASSNAYIWSSASGGILNLGTRTAPNNNINVSVTANGLTFNGDTAAANALDDYEEGTWTMGVSFGGASVGVTTSINTGTYTKIGRQVTVNGYLILTNKGSSVGTARLTGLPFTVANNNEYYSPAVLRLDSITFANQFQSYCVINTTTIELEEITEAGTRTKLTDADFANNSNIMVSLTYFV
jgi:hypothetical protein